MNMLSTEKSTEESTEESAEQRLMELWGEIRDLRAAEDLLHWDQETCMPTGGLEARARAAATLAGIKHQKLTAAELSDTLERCEEEAPPGSDLEAQIRAARIEVIRAVRVSEGLTRALAKASSTGLAAWQEARAQKDFSRFEKELAELLNLRRQQAAAIDPQGQAYDVMIQEYEPDGRAAELAPLFDDLRRNLMPLVRTVAESGVKVNEGACRGDFPVAAQESFSRRMATAIGFDFRKGRLDATTHPFCVGIHRTDVRLTWRSQNDDFRPALFGILHEAGHGLYEQGLPESWSHTPLGTATSLGIHESQSLLWENHVGRSLGFWRFALPFYRKNFPLAPAVEAEELQRAQCTVQPSLIRVDADETTYNLHIALRFQLERALFAGDLTVAELPGAWDDLYEEFLGIRPRDAAEGVLQDIHWSQGMFGYFPTYTLGTLTAAQLFAAARRDLGDLEEAFAAGEFTPLLHWLRENVHRHGTRYTASELVTRATGRPLSADDLLAHLRRNVETVYGLQVEERD